jgi:hypothetical protein
MDYISVRLPISFLKILLILHIEFVLACSSICIFKGLILSNKCRPFVLRKYICC